MTRNELDILTSATRNENPFQSWGLDGSGNFSAFDDDGSSQTRSTDEANQIANISGTWITPAYDGAGNMISGPKPGDEATRVHYVYDAWNRLVAVKFDDSGAAGDTFVSFQYDGLSRRVKKTDERDGLLHEPLGWGDHYYYNRDWQVLEDREVDDLEVEQAINDYVWSPDYIDTPMVCVRDGDMDGTVTGSYTGRWSDWSRYYLTDANHNVTTTIRYDNYYDQIVDATVNVYTPYGVVQDRIGSDAAFDGPLYCGYFYDVNTGLYQVRNRYYDAGLSTWISRDPISYLSGDANLYRDCHNSPIVYVDPSGLADAPIFQGHNTEDGRVTIILTKSNIQVIQDILDRKTRQYAKTVDWPQKTGGWEFTYDLDKMKSLAFGAVKGHSGANEFARFRPNASHAKEEKCYYWVQKFKQGTPGKNVTWPKDWTVEDGGKGGPGYPYQRWDEGSLTLEDHPGQGVPIPLKSLTISADKEKWSITNTAVQAAIDDFFKANPKTETVYPLMFRSELHYANKDTGVKRLVGGYEWRLTITYKVGANGTVTPTVDLPKADVKWFGSEGQ